ARGDLPLGQLGRDRVDHRRREPAEERGGAEESRPLVGHGAILGPDQGAESTCASSCERTGSLTSESRRRPVCDSISAALTRKPCQSAVRATVASLGMISAMTRVLEVTSAAVCPGASRTTASLKRLDGTETWSAPMVFAAAPWMPPASRKTSLPPLASPRA